MGSIIRRGDRFIAQWVDGAGKQRQRTLRAGTERTAEKEGRKLLADLEQLADRQRLGLAPLVTAVDLTVGELVGWWWNRVKARLRSHTVHGFLVKNLAPLWDVPAVELSTDRFSALLDALERELSPESLNKLRARAHQIFKMAAKQGGPWAGRPNPISDVPRRRVVAKLPTFIAAADVPAVLARLEGQDQQVVATAIYTGCRKGEIGGLRKQDVHLDSGEIWLQRCWDGRTTKDGKPAVIPIHPDLRPYLEAAIDASPSELVFPRADGSMHRRDVGWDDALRRAVAAAGIVDGHVHGCRAHRCGYRERRAAAEPLATCPRCGKPTTWVRAVPRHLTFKDLRHTTATLLLKAGVPLATVQRILRHSDPKLTAMIYGHLEVEDMRAGLDRLQFGPRPSDGTAPGLHAARYREKRSPRHSRFPKEQRGLQMVGATGFEPATTCTPSKCATRLRYAPKPGGR